MKKQLLILVMVLLPMVASAHDIEVQNADGVTIYYNYTNDATELEVTYRGNSYSSYNEYTGKVVIPEEVTYMTRTRKVTSIRFEAFRDCSSLTSITIGNGVTSIGQRAFFRCFCLTSVTIPNSVTSIGATAFEDCIGLTSVTIPNSVTSIDDETFYNCRKLSSVTIPNSVTSIGRAAFSQCPSLTSVTIPNSVTSIGAAAFCGCIKFVSVTIPNSVTSIGNNAFMNCTGLTSVTIPNSVTSIGNYAFSGCLSLNSVTIPNSVMSIGNNAFDGPDMPTVISLNENPFTIYGKTSDYRTFSLNTFNNATLYVPKGTIAKYKAADGWKDFAFIEESGTTPTPPSEKCEKPSITYVKGKLTFACNTEGATCYYSITDTDIKEGSGSEVQLAATYNISVYATKSGYENSDTATATLCWIDQQPSAEGDINGIANIPAKALLIKNNGGQLTVEGAADGEAINIYTVNGVLNGSTISQKGAARIDTNLKAGSIAIVKIGDKSVKVVIR